MKLLILFTIVACLQVSAKGFGQSVTLTLKDAPLEYAFKEIKKQTGYSFVYTRDQLKNTIPVNCQLNNVDLKKALSVCFQNQPLSFVIEDRYIVVQTQVSTLELPLFKIPLEIKGKVINENEEIIVGATVTVKRTGYATVTNDRGEFEFRELNASDVLIVSGAELDSKEIPVINSGYIIVKVKIKVNDLDQVIVMGYGETTKRLSTGNISRVSSEEIKKQPVFNLLAALEGRVPGLTVTSTSGLAGSQYKLEIRGKTSVGSNSTIFRVSNDPLIIIDGVPYSANNNSISYITSALNTADLSGGLSALASINPGDIESIEVLKDADATSIYGSRGANGVILITTKKGKAGKSKFDINFYSGVSSITRPAKMLNTQQYVQMRKEAFANDNIVPTSINAPDLLIYDTIRYTDYVDYFIGGHAKTSNLQASMSGGNDLTQFLIGTSYHHEMTVFPGDFASNRSSVHFNLTNRSKNRKLIVGITSSYSSDKNNLVANDFASLTIVAPNTPAFYDNEGKIIWEYNGYHFNNPMGALLKKYTSQTSNLLGNLNVEYAITSYLKIKSSFGYNSLRLKETRIDPLSSEDPFFGTTTAVSQFGYNNYTSWVIEPQVQYERKIRKGKIQALVGGTFQANVNDVLLSTGSGFPNDNLLGSLAAAQYVTSKTYDRRYRYDALFGRFNYNLDQCRFDVE